MTRNAPAGGGSRDVIPTLYTHLTPDPESRTFECSNLTILNNRSNHGENVAAWAQANKFAQGPLWAGAFELQDSTGTRGFFGAEVDVTTGESRVDGRPVQVTCKD